MGVREIREAQIRPECLGNVHNDITPRIPWGEDADLGFALWVDGAIEEADTRVPRPRVGEDAKRVLRLGLRRDVPIPNGAGDLFGRHPGGGDDLFHPELVMGDHISQPVTQFGLISRLTRVAGRLPQGGDQEATHQHSHADACARIPHVWRV